MTFTDLFYHSGTLRKENNYCISGEWTISIMEGTNLFLVVIENYDADTGDVSIVFSFFDSNHFS